MRRVGVVTGEAPSLRVVGESLAYALNRAGYEARLYTRQVFVGDAKKSFERAIVFIPFDPIYLPSWVLLQRDYNLCGIPSVTYVTVEGVPKKWLIPDWIRRDGVFVANSAYTAKMLRRVDVEVKDVIHHGLNLEEISSAQPDRSLKRELKAQVLFGTVASGQYRKGLDKLAQAVKAFSQRRQDAKFFILTTPSGVKHFEGLANAHVSADFGNLPRQQVLSTMASFDYYVCSSYAEGFCLPVLEAQALGVPCVIPEYEPLTEIAHPTANLKFKVTDERWVDYGYGMHFHIHDYSVEDVVQQLDAAYETCTGNRGEYEEMREKVKGFAAKFDAVKLYTRFMDIMV